MNSKLLVWAGLLCLLYTPYLSAQQKSYSLEEIWQKTLDQHPSLAAKKELVERQELTKSLVRQQSYPEIHVQAQQSFGSYQSMPGAFFPLPGQFNNSGSAKTAGDASSAANMYGSAVLQWDFMQFGRIDKKLRVADAAIALGRTALSQEAFRLQVVAARAYFDVLYRWAQVGLLRSDAQRLASLLDLLKSQADAGLRPGADTLLLQSAFLQARNQITGQQAQLQASLLQLAALTGEEGVSVDSSVYYRLPAGSLSAGAGVSHHPYLQYLQATIEHSRAQLDAIRREPYPSVGLLAGVGVKGSGIESSGAVRKSLAAPWSNNSGSYLVGLGVTWKLSSLYANKAKRQIAERQIASEIASQEAATLQLTTLYRAAVASFRQQVTNVQDAHLALEASRRAYELYAVRYDSGLINLIELLQLQKELQGAERNYVAAVHAYWSELLNQAEALGQPSILLTALQP